MRELYGHDVNAVNSEIAIFATDKVHSSGANHCYVVTFPDGRDVHIDFQNGPIGESGVNGLTHEVLLTIVADRLRGFQDGPYCCRENALALTKIEEALQWLHYRTRSRQARGVEGTHAI
jgi:hypothetical protein